MEIHSFDELRENLRGAFDLDLKTEESEFAADSRFFVSNRVILSTYRITPMGFDHNPTRLLQFDTEFVLLERYFTGSARGMVDETSALFKPGKLCLIDWSRRFRTITTEVSGHSLLIPHDLVGFDPSRHRAYCSLDAASVGGSLLSLTLDRFFAAVVGGNTDEASLCARLCINLIRSFFLDGDDKPSRHEGPDLRAKGYLARAYIQSHLADPELSPACLSRNLNASRATIYRLFEDEGGIVQYIDGLRLERCFGELLHAPRRRGEVQRIAEAWGFHDAAVFNRKFRRHFGMAPSDALARATPSSSSRTETSQVWPVNHWLQKTASSEIIRR